MKRIAFVMLLCGCAAQEQSQQEAATAVDIQYSVSAPYQINGSSPAGSDGFVYSVLPCGPLACDPWHLLFCYQSMCFTLSQPLQFLPSGEQNLPLESNGNLTASGNLSCPSWTTTSRVSWYDATPLHWHVALNATCSDGSFSIRGSWQRIYSP